MKAPPRESGKRSASAGRAIGRVLWFCVKLFTIPVLCIVALIVGLAIGYSMLGDGSLSDVFDVATWKHMYDLVFAD